MDLLQYLDGFDQVINRYDAGYNVKGIVLVRQCRIVVEILGFVATRQLVVELEFELVHPGPTDLPHGFGELERIMGDPRRTNVQNVGFHSNVLAVVLGQRCGGRLVDMIHQTRDLVEPSIIVRITPKKIRLPKGPFLRPHLCELEWCDWKLIRRRISSPPSHQDPPGSRVSVLVFPIGHGQISFDVARIVASVKGLGTRFLGNGGVCHSRIPTGGKKTGGRSSGKGGGGSRQEFRSIQNGVLIVW
mmetsp:Transcript_13495/g.37940  ORF Transcript_13495/g.37940 Transcript_13495/m.37940 type:complete len:245 (-) Transcript_13495:308-1042(-)